MKYLSLLKDFFKYSLMADLEYRANIVVKIFGDIIWYITQLSVFEVIFIHTNVISGWTIDTIRVFMGILFVVDSLWMLLFSANIDMMSEKVRKGDLDLLLTKPVNSQFMISMQRINTPYIGNFAIALSWLGWSLSRLDFDVSVYQYLSMLIMIPSGVCVVYASRFFFSAMALILVRAESIGYLWYQIYRLGTRPDSIYPTWLRFIVLTFLPVGFIASVPSRLLIQADYYLVGASVFMAALCIAFSNWFWRFGLKFYSSASS